MGEFRVFVIGSNGKKVPGQPEKGFTSYKECRSWVESKGLTNFTLEQADGLS